MLLVWQPMASLAALSCEGRFSKWAELESVLAQDRIISQNEDALTSQEATVQFKEYTAQGQVVFSKHEETRWRSDFDGFATGQSPQGDLRYPVAIAGAKISSFLGFGLRRTGLGTLEFSAPLADLLKSQVLKLNSKLKWLQYEPLTFLPLRNGYVGAREMVIGSIQKLKESSDILMSFPYADRYPQLVAHEVSFHLGMMFFPNELIQRARIINIRTIQMLNMLNRYPAFRELVEALIDQRSLEMDIGTAIPQAALAEMRINSGLKTYRELHRTYIHQDGTKQLLNFSMGLNYLIRPRFSPAESVIQAISSITGMAIGKDVEISKLSAFTNSSLGPQLTETKVKLSPQDQEILKSIMAQFRKENRRDETEFAPIPENKIIDKVFHTLDERLRQLEEAVHLLSQEESR